MRWLNIKERYPHRSGKYVVIAVGSSKLYSTQHKFEARYHHDPATNKGSFDVSNQVVTHWLEEDEQAI